jgi:surface polysaccharide O-acyltransferase-like enzyme
MLSLSPFIVIGAYLEIEIHFAGWNRWAYLLFILCGFTLASAPQLARRFMAIQRQVLALALVTFVVAVVIYATQSANPEVNPMLGSTWLDRTFRALFAASGWLWVLSILNYARGIRSGRSSHAQADAIQPSRVLMARAGTYLQEAVLPVYVLHQTIIVMVAYVVVEWSIPAIAKYAMIVLISFVLTMVIYEVAVRRAPLSRFLFGMKPRPTSGTA